MKTHAIDTILDLLPLSPGQFGGSEFPLPIKTAYMASESLDIAVLRKQLEAKVNGDVKQLLDPLLLAAEAIESVAPDRDKFFVSDGLLQGYVFMGSKWRAGWACVLGGGDNAALYDELRKRDFMLFTDQPNVADSWYLGYRSTSPIYFLQMMVRYGMIWGRIKPGDDHQMGHFLETDLPGLLILREGMDPLKYLIALGMMKLGAPALVPSSFPFPYGNRVVADTNAEILDRMNGFANLRRKYVGTEVLSLPEYANPAFANEEFDPVWILGNDDNSFFCVLSAGTLSFPDPAPADGDTAIGIAVEVNESEFTDDIGSVVENAALRSLNFLHHERANVTKGIFSLELGGEAAASQSQWEETVRSGIRLNYPGIRNLTIHFYRNTTDVQLLGKQVRQYQGARRAAMDAMTEENTTQFCVCTECRPFSLVHTCILTPDRMPMCASRTYFSVKAGHYFGSGDVPYKRQSESLVPLRKVFDRGRIIDASRGEYEGVNAMYKEMTHGILDRAYLHSLKDVPHTSCGCFQNLAFFIGETSMIGIMRRGSQAKTPDGRTWEMLANFAGGKQSPGIMGVSTHYIRSPQFLRGDGGIKAVAWMDSELYSSSKKIVAHDQKVATEKDVATMDELRQFLVR